MGKKKIKLLNGLLNIVILAAWVMFIWQGVELLGEWSLSWDKEMLGSLEEYYEFEPNDTISTEARKRFEAYTNDEIYEVKARVYTEYLTKWANETGIKILRLEPYTLYEHDTTEVLSYLNSASYDMEWEDFTLPLKEGRWFQDNKDEVICISGFTYNVGDVIILKDKNGQAFEAEVVGKTKYPYIVHNNMGLAGNLGAVTDDCISLSNVFLLNPESEHNEKTDLINYGTTLLKIESGILRDEITNLGTCTKISHELIYQTPDYLSHLITIGVFFVVYIICIILKRVLKKQLKMLNYSVVILKKQPIDMF